MTRRDSGLLVTRIFPWQEKDGDVELGSKKGEREDEEIAHEEENFMRVRR